MNRITVNYIVSYCRCRWLDNRICTHWSFGLSSICVLTDIWGKLHREKTRSCVNTNSACPIETHCRKFSKFCFSRDFKVVVYEKIYFEAYTNDQYIWYKNNIAKIIFGDSKSYLSGLPWVTHKCVSLFWRGFLSTFWECRKVIMHKCPRQNVFTPRVTWYFILGTAEFFQYPFIFISFPTGSEF